MMTNWLPDIAARKGPRYIAIAQKIADAIEDGSLPEGARLPTHRDLAWRLGVTVGTVTRAYAEAERMGLIGGEVGRGTFVRAIRGTPATFFPNPSDHEGPDTGLCLDRNYPSSPLAATALARTLGDLAKSDQLGLLMRYAPRPGMARHRAAGAKWMRRMGLAADADRTLITAGSQHALAVCLAALAKPGDTLLTETLTWGGIKALAGIYRIRVQGLPMDQDGLRPDAFEAAAKDDIGRVVYLNPTLHNPTTVIMPDRRRREIAAIAERHGVFIIEDDIYGPLLDPPATPIAAHAPNHGLYVAGTSKTLGPGLRVAFVHAPERLVATLTTTLRATATMAAPMLAEIVARWIDDGTAEACTRAERGEIRARQAIAKRLLRDADVETRSESLHLWLSLPEPWRADEFVAAARIEGVNVTAAEAFAAGRAQAPHAVRVCLGAVPDRTALEKGLGILAGLLAGAPASRAVAF
jgi:DNA-binding transcriptional MocR family regulator